MTASSPPRPFSSSLRFWSLTIGLFIVWTVVYATAAPPTALATPEKDLKNARNCKALCEHCGCLGFYCGEECICECNKDNSDTECISTMQNNARKLDIPFEILIQGPNKNRFVRTALQFDQNADPQNVALSSVNRNKRSNIVIYKPSRKNSLNDQYEKASKKHDAGARHKRSVPQLDWFNDFANTLVRPAPLGSHRAAEETVAESSMQQKRPLEELDRSWFADNNNILLRPAPLFKRPNSDRDDSYEMPAAVVEKFPQMIKDTIRSIQETAINEDFGDALRSKIKEGTDVIQNRLQNNNFDIMPNTLRDNFAETLSNMKLFRPDANISPPASPTTSLPASETAPKFMIPWFRPVRFLKRVQDAIN